MLTAKTVKIRQHFILQTANLMTFAWGLFAYICLWFDNMHNSLKVSGRYSYYEKGEGAP